MKFLKLSLVFFCFLGAAEVCHAEGPYEIGKMNVDGNVCRWTSMYYQNCTREEMQAKMKEMDACYSPRFETEMEDCPDMACVKERIKNIIEECCAQTDGEMQ